MTTSTPAAMAARNGTSSTESSWCRSAPPSRPAVVVMSAHIALPGLDAGPPGTIVLTGILRDSLGFQGMIVTDALNMAGVANAYGAQAGVRAFLAGADLLLQPADPAAAIDAMAAAGPWRDQRATARPLGPAGARGQAPAGSLRPPRRLRTASRPWSAAPASRPWLPASPSARSFWSRTVIHGLAALALVTYAEEVPDGRRIALAAELRARDHPRRGSGPPAARRATTRRSPPPPRTPPPAVFATADRPIIAGRGLEVPAGRAHGLVIAGAATSGRACSSRWAIPTSSAVSPRSAPI